MNALSEPMLGNPSLVHVLGGGGDILVSGSR